MQLFEDILGDFSVHLGRSSSKVVKVYVKPLIYLRMNFIVEIADFLGSFPLFDGFGFSGSAVFVSPAHVESIVAPKAAESCINICRKHAPNDIPKMRHVIDVGECRCDEDVSFARLGQHDLACGQPGDLYLLIEVSHRCFGLAGSSLEGSEVGPTMGVSHLWKVLLELVVGLSQYWVQARIEQHMQQRSSPKLLSPQQREELLI
mmetsp:Transcript_34486/g.25579  ORF Transcript_34486/g.25579 Transcript_34486/m.25579 type:complete len:204 (+) Transcript_34486:144-755(+)